MIEYTLTALLWSLGGFLLGYGMGRIVKDVEEVRDAVIPDRPRPKSTRYLPSRQTIIGVLVILIAVSSTTMVFRQADHLQDVTACQAQYNEDFRVALSRRLQASDDEADAQRNLLRTITSTPNGDSSAAIGRYLVALDDLEKARAQNPLPKRTDCR